MMDTDGDGSITQEEFLRAAKECLAAQKAAAQQNAELNDALRTVQRLLKNDQVQHAQHGVS